MRALLCSALFALCLTPTRAIWRCPEGWSTILFTRSDRETVYTNCYLFYKFGSRTPRLTYGEARAYCQDAGGNLATFQDETELDHFITWISDKYDSAKALQKQSDMTFMLGYAYLRMPGEIVYEGVADANLKLNETDHWQDPTDVGVGEQNNVVIITGARISPTEPVLYSVSEASLSNIANMTGFVCKKPKGEDVCSKLNKPYVSSFGGRRVPIRPYSRYALMSNPIFGNVAVYTYGTPKELDPSDSLLAGAALGSGDDFPRHGAQIKHVDFTVFYEAVNESTVQETSQSISWWLIPSNWTFSVYRNPGLAANTWSYRTFSNGTNFAVAQLDAAASPIVLASYSLAYSSIVLADYSVVAEWKQGGIFGGGWLITTPFYRFFYDGYDFQLFLSKSSYRDTQRGLCDSKAKHRSNPFFNADISGTQKTMDLHQFAYGQSLSPYLSFTGLGGRPASCTSHALHEGAIRECYDLIDPLQRSSPCLMKALNIDDPTNLAFASGGPNIYQACIESVCAHGPGAKCYYLEKLLSRVQQKCNATEVPPLVISSIRASLECDSPVSICSKQNGVLSNGVCYFLQDSSSMADGEVLCNRLTAHLPAPGSPGEERFIVQNMTGSGSDSTAWMGVMVSMKGALDHTVAFQKAVAIDEAAPLYSRSWLMEDYGDEQCMKLGNGTMTYTSCTEDTDPSTVCVNYVTDPACSVTCMYPNQCVAGKCQDPCPGNQFEYIGTCRPMGN